MAGTGKHRMADLVADRLEALTVANEQLRAEVESLRIANERLRAVADAARDRQDTESCDAHREYWSSMCVECAADKGAYDRLDAALAALDAETGR